MPETWTVLAVEDITDDTGTIPAWKLTLAVPERFDPSGRHVFIVPKDAIQNRAAEYGYATVDEALEHLLYELVLAEKHAAGELPWFNPSAVTAAQARQEAQAQIAWCKEQHAVIGPPAAKARARTADPLQVIRDSTTIDKVRAATLRMEIDRYRVSRGAGG